ncbi:MAG: ATP-binding protein [Treponema sp.]
MIERAIKNALFRIAKSFPVILVTGARQTGKSTLLKNYIQTKGVSYVTFDDKENILAVREDAKLFMAVHKSPAIFDEIQYVPDLFSYIKMNVDSNRSSGMFFLTGSQQFSMMKNVSESLAGRVGILNLLPFSQRELASDSFSLPFVPTQEYILNRRNSYKSDFSQPDEIWKIIQKGMYPEICNGNVTTQDFFSSYIRTYIERDVRLLTQVADEMQFMQFISVAAARTGQLVNYADMARTVGIDPNTAKRWLSVLVSSGIVYLLQPYFGNVEKRIVKTPKLYFVDTGLAAYLTKWSTPEVLMNGAMAGNFFETFAISEMLKSYTNAGIDPPFYFYRDSDGVEVDLLIENNGTLYPVEIKATSTPKKESAKNFHILNSIKDKKIASGTVICNSSDIGIAAKGVMTVPVRYV